MLKKTILALLGLTLSGYAVAGTMGAVGCVSGNATIPCEVKKWELGIQGLYLQPTYSNSLSYAPTTTAALVQRITPPWGWGTRVQGAYLFSTGNDVAINWSHYNRSTQRGLYAGQYAQLIDATTAISVPSNYQLLLDNKYDQVNLVMGQRIEFSPMTKARFYSGLQYAKVRVDMTNYYTTIAPIFLAGDAASVNSYTNTDFQGVGPTFGIDYALDVAEGFSLTANTAGSVLYGTSRYNFATVYGNGLVASSLYHSRKIVTSSLEAKLGANYAFATTQGVLNVEGGYQAINYFNALQALPLTTGTLATSDFGLYGPYLGVKWLGNA
jgi:hypothetical protein